MSSCVFCRIVKGEIPAAKVYEDEKLLVFLDKGPLFHGHCLVIPKQHYETLPDLPSELIPALFGMAQQVCVAVPKAMDAEGTFVAINNIVSQSVPHMHVHVVPRRPKDGLRGFFWPRTKYADDAEMDAVASRIQRELSALA